MTSERTQSSGAGVCLALIGAAALFAVGLQSIDTVSAEALVREAVCRQVLDNTTEGRQALVSSVWWAPLPVLFMLPFAAAVSIETCPIAALIVSSLFGVAALALLSSVLCSWRFGASRYVMVLALAVSPAFLNECLAASSGTAVLFFVMLTAYTLTEWVAQRKLRFLLGVGLSSAFLTGMSFEMAPWLLVVFVLLAIDQLIWRTGGSQKEAVLILALLPSLYTVSLWVLMNWLIMGDGLYFLRSVLAIVGDRRGAVAAHTICVLDCHRIATGVSLFVLVLSLLKRDRAGVWLGTLGSCLVPLAVFAADNGLLWDETPVLFCLLPLCMLAVGYGAGPLKLVPDRVRPLVSLIPLAISVVALLAPGAITGTAFARATRRPAVSEQSALLPLIESHVLARSKYAKVFVCGYDSFLLLGADAGPVFAHALDFNFNKSKDDYRGHCLYLLVHRPVERNAMDSVHWKFDRMFAFGSDTTLYDSDWGDWRLFEIVQAPRRSGR